MLIFAPAAPVYFRVAPSAIKRLPALVADWPNGFAFATTSIEGRLSVPALMVVMPV